MLHRRLRRSLYLIDDLPRLIQCYVNIQSFQLIVILNVFELETECLLDRRVPFNLPLVELDQIYLELNDRHRSRLYQGVGFEGEDVIQGLMDDLHFFYELLP